MFNHKNETILLTGYIYAGLYSKLLSTNAIYDIAMEAEACKIVEDCHQVVSTNINSFYSSLLDMAPALSTRIANGSVSAEELLESTIGSNLVMLLAKIRDDLSIKYNFGVLPGWKNDMSFSVNGLPGGKAFTEDIKFITESYEFSRKVSKLGQELCEAALDKVIPGIFGCLLNKTLLSSMIWDCIKIKGREKQLSSEIEKRLKGLFNNVKIQLLNSINDEISGFVFSCYDEICRRLPEKPESLEALPLTA